MTDQLPFGIKYTRIINFITIGFNILKVFILLPLIIFMVHYIFSRPELMKAEIPTNTTLIASICMCIIGFFLWVIPSIIFFFINRGLKNLKTSARIFQCIFSLFQLPSFPIGTVLHVVALYFMLIDPSTRRAFGKGVVPIDAEEPITLQQPHAQVVSPKENSSKKPVGVYVYGGILIIFGISTAYSLIYMSFSSINYSDIYHMPSFVLYGMSGLTLIQMGVAVYLLRFKEWARKAIFILSGIGIAVHILILPHTLNMADSMNFKEINRQVVKMDTLSPEQAAQMEESLKIFDDLPIKEFVTVITLVGEAIYLIFVISLVLYFRKSRVKMHFL